MSAALCMVKLTPDMRRLAAWAHSHRLVEHGGDMGYAVHAALMAAFAAHAPKPFRLFERASGADLFGYTGASGPELVDHAQTFADPEIVNALRLASLASKAMPAAWTPGRRLGFEVRVRPVIRRDRPGERDAAREQDAFQAAFEGSGATPLAGSSPPRREEVYRRWLAEHIARLGGARLVDASVRLVSFQRLRVARRGRRTEAGRRPLASSEGPDAVLAGVLEVTDSDAFAALLRRGIGRHRAFGFGMMLLRPAGSTQ